MSTDDIEHVAGGRTFFWRGEYGWDLNDRETLDTQLNVFAELPAEALGRRRAPADVLFLANIQPDLQREVRAQCRGRPLRRARLDEPVDRDRPRLAGRDDRRASTACCSTTPSCASSPGSRTSSAPRASPRVGPARGRRQAGRVRRRDGHRGGLLRAAGVPARDRRRSDRRRRLLRRRASSATSPPTPTSELDHDLLCRAMAYGTALASFNVEEFGVERVARLTSDEIAERVAELQRITQLRREADRAAGLSGSSARSTLGRAVTCAGRNPGRIARRDVGIPVVDARAEDSARSADLPRLVGDQAGA